MPPLQSFLLITREVEDQPVSLEQKTTREASLDAAKFIRLFYLRLTTQGVKTTLLWMYNVLNRWLIDRPSRGLSQITPQLFVGGQFRRRGWRVLQRWGISAVVNLRAEFDDRQLNLDLGRYCYIPAEDDQTPGLAELQQGAEFIAEEIQRGGKVYVHCGSGVGRAPTMAAAYLVSLGHAPEEAWGIIRRSRPFIRLTRVQREQIERLAESIRKPVP